MSGRRIDDYGGYPHSSDDSMKFKNKLKKFTSAEGSGHLGMEYPDTTEMIERDQDKGNSKIKSHPIKPGYRN